MPFPLPIVAFEDYMLADDRPDYPMHFGLRLRFVGRLDRAAVETALRRAAERHPLLTARIEGRGSRGRFWNHPPTPVEIPFREATAPVDDRLPYVPLDLSTDGGLVVHRVRRTDGDELYWQFHHACCDGLGGAQVVADWLAAYATAVGDRVPSDVLPALDPDRLRGRGRFGLTLGRLLRKSGRLAIGLSGVATFFGRRAVPLLPITDSDGVAPAPYAGPCAVTHAVSIADVAALRTAGERHGVTVNDLLLSALISALAAFRRRHGPVGADDWLRLAMPVNLRRLEDESLPAANVVGMVLFDRRESQSVDRRGLLHDVHTWTRSILDRELTLWFIFSLCLGRRLPGGLHALRDRTQSIVTCVASNLGQPLKSTALRCDEAGRIVVGDARLDSFELVVPIRTGTGVAFGFVFYAGRLHITLNYDPRMLTAAQGADLLAEYARSITTYATDV